ncbi:hypothetical protein RMCBS344292_03431 [Rhizopus microsporus]|nr:hypothetical protein RMCBS344292_03431 [Rhizopus microsporus]
MTTVHITNGNGEQIVGILQENFREKRLVLIVHGEQGHKNHLYQESLAKQLPYSSFRFDFCGNGDSDGQPGYDHIEKDADDIHYVASHFKSQGYEIYAIIGFGRGSLSGLKYANTCERPLSHFVNIAAPFLMKDDTLISQQDKASLEKNGYFTWKAYQKGALNDIKVNREAYEAYAAWDNSHVIHMPKATCVLTIHSIDDKVVPAYHAAMFANKISNHTLMLLPNADHQFMNHHDDLIDIILKYFDKHEKDAYRKAVAMGQHVSVVIPRWIDVEGVMNFRDIGGWPIKDGSGYIRERIIFRCGHLAGITPKGIETLKRLNVIAVFDFRSEPEIERQGHMPDIHGVTHVPSAMFTKADYSPAAMASRWKGYFEGPYGFPKVYAVILEKGAPYYRKIFLHLLQNHSIHSNKSIIVHCTAGKDRTGIFCMLLLGLCGVDDEIIANEYGLSSLGYWEPEEELQRKAVHLNVTVDDVRIVTSAPYIAMKETIRLVKEKYGSIEGYIRNECGLRQEEIQGIKDLMIVPIRFEERQLFRPKI